MSGIAGIFNLNGRPVDGQKLHAMTKVVAHRGPDGIGHWVKGPVGLGQLQLCTTPESRRERQPLVSADGNYVIVCDGRVDNREELVRELRSLAPVTPASTDVELILNAYIAWGAECPKHIVGDFAFAIWDTARQQLFCARDPIGMRIFHYHFDGQRFIFGTEIKQVFQHGDVPRRLNELMLGLYLCGNFGDGEMTFYDGVSRLKGGYSLVVSKKGLSEKIFWNPDPADQIRYTDETEYVEHFRELLFEAVGCRLRSNTGVEVLLSGGLDSGSVASTAGYLRELGRGGEAQVSANSWIYREPPLDESPYVKLIAERYGIPVTWIQVDDLWAMRPAPSDTDLDEPFRLHFEAMHCAALDSVKGRGIRVILTGEGGDETAMPGFMLHFRDWLRHLQWWRLWRDLQSSTPAYRRAAIRTLRSSLLPEWVHRLSGHHGVSIPPWVQPEFVHDHRLVSWLRRSQPRSRRTGIYLQQRGRNPIFPGGEVRCARYGIEWRHPFYDSRLVEFLARIPPEVRFRGGRSKVLLREAMSGVLPEEVRQRAQHGAFGPLLKQGLRQMEVPRLLGLLQESHLAAMGVLDTVPLEETFKAYVQGDDAKLGRVLWAFFAEQWLRDLRPGVLDQCETREAGAMAGNLVSSS